jgi:hypothetical protein
MRIIMTKIIRKLAWKRGYIAARVQYHWDDEHLTSHQTFDAGEKNRFVPKAGVSKNHEFEFN